MKFAIYRPYEDKPEQILKDYPALKNFNFEILPLTKHPHVIKPFITINSLEEFTQLLNLVRPIHGLIFQQEEPTDTPNPTYSIWLYDDYME